MTKGPPAFKQLSKAVLVTIVKVSLVQSNLMYISCLTSPVLDGQDCKGMHGQGSPGSHDASNSPLGSKSRDYYAFKRTLAYMIQCVCAVTPRMILTCTN